MQSKVAEEYKAEGHHVSVGWGHNQPDIVLEFPYGLPPIVISVKSFKLVQSNMRYGEDGRHSYASARTIKRKDVIAEMTYALSTKAYTVILTVINQRNEVAEHVELDPATFSQYTTSQRLNDDNGKKEFVLDLSNEVTLEENKELGWARDSNP